VNEVSPSGTPLSELVERAFDYRGYVTVRRADGSEIVGYLYDRGPAHVDLLDETATQRTRLSRDEIVDIRFTGDDPVRKSQEIWERRKGSLEPRDTPAYGEWAAARPVLLAVALEQELVHVARALGLRKNGASARGRHEGSEVVAVAAGIGDGAAGTVADEEPRLVVSCGFCGALDARLETGDVVIGSAVRSEAGEVLQAPADVLERARRALSGLPFYEGELLDAKAVATTPAEKRALANAAAFGLRPSRAEPAAPSTGALALDMETRPLALAARKAGIPWLAVRVVLDPVDQALPAFTREPRKSYVAPAIRHALSGPRGAVQIARLASASRRAGASLEDALRRLGKVLA